MSRERIREEMDRLTRPLQDAQLGVFAALCELLGFDASEGNEEAAVREMAQALQLATLHYEQEGVPSEIACVGAGFVQGVAFAIATRNVLGSDPR